MPIIAALIVIYLVVMFAWLLLAFLLATCDAISLGVVCGLMPGGMGGVLTTYLRDTAFRALRNGDLLARSVTVTSCSGKLTWDLKDQALRRLCHINTVVPLTLCAGTAALVLGQAIAADLHLFNPRTFSWCGDTQTVSASATHGWMVFWSIATALSATGVWLQSGPHAKLVKEIQDYAANLLESFTTEVEGNGKLAAIARDVDGLACELQIGFPIEIDSYAADLLSTRADNLQRQLPTLTRLVNATGTDDKGNTFNWKMGPGGFRAIASAPTLALVESMHVRLYPR